MPSDGHHWSDFFVQWGLGVVIVIGALIGSVMIPTAKRAELLAARDLDSSGARAGEAAQATVNMSEEYRALASRLAAVGSLLSVLVLVTILIMVIKPLRPLSSDSAGTLMSSGYRVAVVGATGQVGTLMLELLRERAFPVRELVPFASARSVGRELTDGLVVQGLSDESIQGFDLALFSAGGSTSGEWAPRFADAGAVVIDNSSRWRMQDDVPLVVAEVNPDALADHHGIIANPNCSTMQMVVALKPLHDEAQIERLVISTYQAVSGTGKRRSTSCSTSRTRSCTSARSSSRTYTRTRSPSTRSRTPAASRPARTTPTRSAS